MTVARILVVDDEAQVRDGVSLGLQLGGYVVDSAASGPEALVLLAEAHYDLAVLDMQMPGMDGVTLMRRAREIDPDLLIIILTGHATLESAIAAVKAGAADYLLKPASIHELAAVITTALEVREAREAQQRALRTIGAALDALRDPRVTPLAPELTTQDDDFIVAGALSLDPRKRTVTVLPPAGDIPRTAELTEGESDLLATLMRQPGAVFSARELVRRAWGYDLEEAAAVSAVRSCVYRLRQKLEADPQTPSLIRTVRGGGYYLDI